MSHASKLTSETHNKSENNGLRPFILDPQNLKGEGNGLRDFILDPKASVKKYIENNMGPGSTSQQPEQWNQQNGNSQGLASPPLPERPQSAGRVQSYTSLGYAPEEVGQSQQPSNIPTRSSHVKRVQLVDYSNFAPPPALTATYQQQESAVPPSHDVRLVGPAPPPAEPQVIFTLPAPRLYHRMITEYETIKAVFYAASMQPSHNDLSPLASKLKHLCREIWNIRYTRSAEFAYNEATTEERITEWKAQFEYWADVLEDLLDPRYVAKVEAEAKESDWAGLAGLSAAPASSTTAAKKKVVKAAAVAAEDDEPAPVVKKKVVKATTAGEEEAAPVKKKKVVKKVAAAAE